MIKFRGIAIGSYVPTLHHVLLEMIGNNCSHMFCSDWLNSRANSAFISNDCSLTLTFCWFIKSSQFDWEVFTLSELRRVIPLFFVFFGKFHLHLNLNLVYHKYYSSKYLIASKIFVPIDEDGLYIGLQDWMEMRVRIPFWMLGWMLLRWKRLAIGSNSTLIWPRNCCVFFSFDRIFWFSGMKSCLNILVRRLIKKLIPYITTCLDFLTGILPTTPY